MPGGFGDPTGFAVFTAIKLVGYSAFAMYLNNLYPASKRNFFYVGLTRTLLGIAFGIALALLSFPFVFIGGIGFLIYFLGLIPVRILEWYIIVRGFYIKDAIDKSLMKRAITFGVISSFVLDIPAIIGFVATGGFWIC